MIKRSTQYKQMINSTRWRKLRARALSRDGYLCQHCKRFMLYRAATEVHHIKPVEWATTPEAQHRRMFDIRNLISLCHSCHVAAHIALCSHKGITKEEARANLEGRIKDFFTPRR